jgi:hypothetical protein
MTVVLICEEGGRFRSQVDGLDTYDAVKLLLKSEACRMNRVWFVCCSRCYSVIIAIRDDEKLWSWMVVMRIFKVGEREDGDDFLVRGQAPSFSGECLLNKMLHSVGSHFECSPNRIQPITFR